MIGLYIFTALALLISLICSPQKTWAALKAGASRFRTIAPELLMMIVLASLALYLIPDEVLTRYLGQKNQLLASGLGMLFGSITLLPGFIAFPICGLLLQKGVSYFVLAIFTTTMMMVGVVTFPLERSYFGTKLAFWRNVTGLLIAITVACCIGLAYGELHL